MEDVIDRLIDDEKAQYRNFQHTDPRLNISVNKFLTTDDIRGLFHQPLSEQAEEELQQLRTIIQQTQWQEQSNDQWHYIWGTPKYSSSKMYNYLYKNLQPPDPIYGYGTLDAATS